MMGINWTIIVINSHSYLFILIIFIHVILVCEIEIDLGGQKLVVNAAQTFINKIV